MSSRGDVTKAELKARCALLEEAVAEKDQELRAALADLDAARSRLREQAALVSLGRLVAGIAHELKNPANFIYGGSAALVERLEQAPSGADGEASGKLLRLAEVIRTGGERIRELIDTLNTFRDRGGQSPRQLDLGEALRQTVALLEPQARHHQVKIAVKVQPELSVLGHRGALYQVLTNIVLNAMEASPPGGVVEITSSARPGEISLMVRDQGDGIPSDLRERLFEPFFTTKGVEGGTGLGLTICRQIIEDQGGRIEVDTPPDGGALFTLTFSAKGTVEDEHPHQP